MVEKATDGRLIFETIIDLVPEAELMYATMDGRVDMSFAPIEEISGTYPQWTYGSIPFYWSSGLEYEKAMNDPRMRNLLTTSYANAGLVFVTEVGGCPLNAVWANKPIRTIEDFAGLKTRSPGLLPTHALDHLGAAPLTIDVEMTEALRRGTVDAALCSITYGSFIGLADVCDYISIWNLQPALACTITANPDKFNALPADLQQILLEVAQTFSRQSAFAIYIQYEVTAPMLARTYLDVIIPEKAEIDRAIELTRPCLDDWLEMTGPEGEAILDVCKEYASGAR